MRVHLDIGSWWQNLHFCLSGPSSWWPSNCMKIHPIAVFLLLTALALVHPLGFLKEACDTQLLAMVHLQWNVTSTRWPQYDTQCFQTHSRSLLPHGKSQCGLWVCLQGLESAGSHTAMILVVRSPVEAWRSHVLEAKQYLQDQFSSVSSVAQSCPTHCDPMSHSTPGLPVHHQLPEFTQTYAHQVGDAIQPSHPLSSPSPPAPNPTQHQGLFQWVNSSHEVAKVLEFQLQHQSFQWTPRTDLL